MDIVSIYDYLEKIEKEDTLPITDIAYIGDYSLLSRLSEYCVILYCDYDCDGLASLAMLYKYCKKNNIECYPVLNKREYGYGLNKKVLENSYRVKSVLPKLLFTADLGITNIDEVEYAYSLGYDKVIITDHHNIQGEVPKADLIIDNKIDFKLYNDFCGCGNVFYILNKTYTQEELILATIATIGDMVNIGMNTHNREIVKLGLLEINKGIDEEYLRLLFEKSLYNNYMINESDISFSIVPIINSLSREGYEEVFHKIFLYKELEYIDRAIEINKERKELQSLYQEKIDNFKFTNNDLEIIALQDVKHSYLGLLSSYALHKYGKDNITLSNSGDKYSGSGRSKTVDIFKYIEHVKEVDPHIRGGGHTNACGIGNVDVKTLENNRENLILMESLEKTYLCNIGELYNELVEYKLNQIKPFGMGNPAPQLKIIGTINSIIKYKKLTKFHLVDDSSFSSLSCIYFSSVKLSKNSKVEVIGTYDSDKLVFIVRKVNKI